MPNFDLILQSFGLDPAQYVPELFGSGLIHATYIVRKNKEPEYILQRVNHQVFKKPEDVAHNIRIIGNFLDRKGKGASMMIYGAALLTIAHLTFALAPLNMALAIIAIIVLGVAFSLVPASMWPSVPKIVEDRYLGSAYALVFWIQNIGLMFIPWLVGVVLKAVNPGIAERIQAGETGLTYNYTVPMLIFAGLGILAIFLGYMLKREDKKKNYGLEAPNKRS